MTRILTGSDIGKAAAEICNSDQEVYLAVAFWNGETARALGVTKGKKIRVVLDVNMGGTSALELTYLRKALKADVRVHPDLHAKIYATKDHALVGSANASKPGLRLDETRGGHAEAAVILDGKDAEQAFELAKRFWEEGVIATKAHVKICAERFGRKSVADAEADQVEPLPFLKALLTYPDLLSHYPFIVTCEETTDEKLEKNWQKQRNELNPGGPEQDYDHSKWDNFDWRLDDYCKDRLCIALHRDPEGKLFFGLVKPVFLEKGKWTFARRVSWREVAAVKGDQIKAQFIRKNESGRVALDELMTAIGNRDDCVVPGHEFVADLKVRFERTKK